MQGDGSVTLPALVMPFHLRGYEGHVSVFYGVNRDPDRWGYGRLGLPFPIERAIGFPVRRAEIAYAGEGYRAVLGWLQVITVTDRDGERRSSVDVAPIHRESDTPFAKYGYLPTLFDAPGPNPPRSDETWVAESWLASVPDVARSRRVRAVLGFRWGYVLTEGRAALLDLQVADANDWRRCRDVLGARYPGWQFAEPLGGE